MEAGSELGFHRGGFSGMDFNSLMVVDMWKLTVWVREKAARRQSDHQSRARGAPSGSRDSHVVVP